MSRSFYTLVSVFFFWGFVAASNDILIPVFKNELNLEQWQSQLISFAFYIAYTVGSVIYYLISLSKKGDLLNRMGYKNGLVLGLLISASGTLLFIPAAQTASFPIMISGLFIVGLGFSLQQTVANPLAINLGDPKKGSQRLSFAGGINNIGTTIGPILVSLAIFGSVATDNVKANISNIQIPYLILGLAFILVAIIFKFSSIPNKIDGLNETEQNTNLNDSKPVYADRTNALKYPQLILGMIAIFVYVGVEVSTGGNLGAYLEQKMGIETKQVAPFVSLFWASLMIGRWTSAAEVFTQNKSAKNVLRFLLPYMAFGLFLLMNYVVGNYVGNFYYYAAVIVIMIGAEWISKGNPARQLLIFSGMGIVALFVGILSTNAMVGAYAFMSVGLFCSTLWPCIFTLAIAGLGKHTNQGSGFLIMMIMGGGFISLLQGYLAKDELLGIQWSYLVGVACFAYLAFYAVRAKQILLKQGINYDQDSSSGH